MASTIRRWRNGAAAAHRTTWRSITMGFASCAVGPRLGALLPRARAGCSCILGCCELRDWRWSSLHSDLEPSAFLRPCLSPRMRRRCHAPMRLPRRSFVAARRRSCRPPHLEHPHRDRSTRCPFRSSKLRRSRRAWRSPMTSMPGSSAPGRQNQSSQERAERGATKSGLVGSDPRRRGQGAAKLR